MHTETFPTSSCLAEWHEALGDPTLADAILDRLTSNAHRIELRGDSMRRRQPENGAAVTQTDGIASEETETPMEAVSAPKRAHRIASEAR